MREAMIHSVVGSLYSTKYLVFSFLFAEILCSLHNFAENLRSCAEFLRCCQKSCDTSLILGDTGW